MLTGKHPTLDRRTWLRTTGAAALALGLGRKGVAQATDRDFRVLLLGDIHFDWLDLHDLAALEADDRAGDVRQIQNYSRLTQEMVPNLFAELRDQVRELDNVRLVAQTGDLIEGLSATPRLARRMCLNTAASIDAADLGVPFGFVKGNHEVAGPGSREAFDEVLLPWVGRQLDVDATSGNFATTEGDVTFVWFDAYQDSSLDWLEATLAQHPGQRIVCLVHIPVIPCSARSTWHIYARPDQADQRARILAALGARNALVLCGHVHKNSVLQRTTDAGTISQICTVSVIPRPQVNPKDHLEGLADYRTRLIEQEATFQPHSLEERRQVLLDEVAHIRSFRYADAFGYAALRFRPGSIGLTQYTGLGRRVWQELNLPFTAG